MAQGPDTIFMADRSAAFIHVAAAIDARMAAIPVSILTSLGELSPDEIRHAGLRESWALLLAGIRHLHNGAPQQMPGSMTEAISRASLRSSALAAALGIRQPRFEQMYFTVDYATGREAVHSLCRHFAAALTQDLNASRRIIHKKILDGPADDALPVAAAGQDVEMLKKQIGLSFMLLSDAYAETCRDLVTLIDA